ncbi:UNVERIFIED_CONTAM: hypothetical protein HDU68_001909 [Siphonaria sp. JEL0065]|nr:hypothetical protein HDU68_001909 [Siphonaria sp. JEL0065]
MSHPIWHRLVHPDYSQVANTDPSKVIAMPAWDVDDLKTAVWKENESLLQPQQVVASGLKVYKNQASLTANEPLRVSANVAGLGQSDEDPVVIVVPSPISYPISLWIVDGSAENALATKGARARLYQLADLNIGYYDPSDRRAFWYDDMKLLVHVLFETKNNALSFESQLRSESVMMGSALNYLPILTNVSMKMNSGSTENKRIFFGDYEPTDSESPQHAMSQISSSITSYYDRTTELFKYQRIESERWYGHLGKAEGAHLMSREHCRKYASSYGRYDGSMSNRLALSRELHGFYDELSTDVPTMNIKYISCSNATVTEGRYRVVIRVSAIDTEYGNIIFNRLKEGSTAVFNDHLSMETDVLVLEPKIFKTCLDWKFKEIEKRWRDYFDMDPAVE